MGKQVVHSSFIAKEGNMLVAFIPNLSHSDIEVEDMTNPLQSVSFTTVNPLQQTNGCELNFLNAIRDKINLDVKVGNTINQILIFLPPS
jgi:hypothetical protein